MNAAEIRAPGGRRVLPWLLLLSLGGCQTVADMVSPPGKTVCRRTAALCSLGEDKQQGCEAQLQELKLDPQRLRDMAACVDRAQSCAEAAGCAAGVGMNAAVDSAKDFLRGMQRAMDKDKK